MNVGSSGAISTLVPQATASGTGQSSGQNWAATKEVENWAKSEPAPAPGAREESWATTKEAENWANTDGPKAPEIKAESWATTKEVENWAGDKPAPDPATQRSDIKV